MTETRFRECARCPLPLLALALGSGIAAAQQQPIELKLAYFVGDQHAMSQWLIKWADKLEKDSGGRIVVKRFPGSQMGPVQQHYDLARTGQADVAWFLHGATPGRFPLTEIVAAALSGRQRRDRHQGAQRSRAAREISRCRAQGREGAAAAHASARQDPHHQEADPHHRRHEGHAAALRLADHSRLRRGARRHAGRRACRPSRSSSCRRARSTACSSITAAPASPSRWAAPSSTRPRCIPTCRASASVMNQDFWNKLPPDLQALVDQVDGRRRKGSRRGLGWARRRPARRR